eukprot:scaffold5588_cov180-Amphora_coffeaeformis.AAC.7
MPWGPYSEAPVLKISNGTCSTKLALGGKTPTPNGSEDASKHRLIDCLLVSDVSNVTMMDAQEAVEDDGTDREEGKEEEENHPEYADVENLEYLKYFGT